MNGITIGLSHYSNEYTKVGYTSPIVIKKQDVQNAGFQTSPSLPFTTFSTYTYCPPHYDTDHATQNTWSIPVFIDKPSSDTHIKKAHVMNLIRTPFSEQNTKQNLQQTHQDTSDKTLVYNYDPIKHDTNADMNVQEIKGHVRNSANLFEKFMFVCNNLSKRLSSLQTDGNDEESIQPAGISNDTDKTINHLTMNDTNDADTLINNLTVQDTNDADTLINNLNVQDTNVDKMLNNSDAGTLINNLGTNESTNICTSESCA